MAKRRYLVEEIEGAVFSWLSMPWAVLDTIEEMDACRCPDKETATLICKLLNQHETKTKKQHGNEK